MSAEQYERIFGKKSGVVDKLTTFDNELYERMFGENRKDEAVQNEGQENDRGGEIQAEDEGAPEDGDGGSGG
jgi:hypothetical protein